MNPWADMDNEELLRTSGLILTDEEGRTGITLAAVLLFGILSGTLHRCLADLNEQRRHGWNW